MARAMWKAVVKFGDATVPVRLYAAAQDKKIHFRLLHAEDHVPVKQQMVRPSTGEVVPPDRIVKGLEVEPGLFVVLGDEELDKLGPKPSREIEVVRFVPRGVISHQWYERPYYLGPDGQDEDYAALAAALEREQVEGVARWVMRGNAYVGALGAMQGALSLVTLRHAEEVVTLPSLELPKRKEPDKKELALAEQLVETLAGEFDPGEFSDEYRERLTKLIRTKARGGKLQLDKFRPRKTTGSLAEVLRHSVAKAKEQRVA
jgi:DNA end-binding protein Ku